MSKKSSFKSSFKAQILFSLYYFFLNTMHTKIMFFVNSWKMNYFQNGNLIKILFGRDCFLSQRLVFIKGYLKSIPLYSVTTIITAITKYIDRKLMLPKWPSMSGHMTDVEVFTSLTRQQLSSTTEIDELLFWPKFGDDMLWTTPRFPYLSLNIGPNDYSNSTF